MTANLYFIKCLTNLHVGSGDVNFNIIDEEIEKDPVTGYPTINASGVKGALRQFFEENAPQYTERLFGSAAKNSQREQNASTPGSLKFLAASLLARPARASAGNNAYHMISTKTALDQLRQMVFSLTGSTLYEIKGLQQEIDYMFSNTACEVEGYPVSTQLDMTNESNKQANKYLKSCIGTNVLILSEDTWKKLPFPVIARNYLENGESENVWYEEYVPHESVFWFMVLGSDSDLQTFHDTVNEKVIQFGGNSSVGYGLCFVKQGGIQDVKAEN